MSTALCICAGIAPGGPARVCKHNVFPDRVADIGRGSLPQVWFYKPQGSLDGHPGYTDVLSGDRHIADLVAKIKASSLWASTAIIITYDENGGFLGNAPPPRADSCGPGAPAPTNIRLPYPEMRF